MTSSTCWLLFQNDLFVAVSVLYEAACWSFQMRKRLGSRCQEASGSNGEQLEAAAGTSDPFGRWLVMTGISRPLNSLRPAGDANRISPISSYLFLPTFWAFLDAGHATPAACDLFILGGAGSLVLGQNQECFGGCFSPMYSLDGSMADVRIWSRALSPVSHPIPLPSLVPVLRSFSALMSACIAALASSGGSSQPMPLPVSLSHSSLAHPFAHMQPLPKPQCSRFALSATILPFSQSSIWCRSFVVS